MAHRSSATASQPATERRHRCPESRCRTSFKRKSDLERHRKCVHHRMPAIGDGCIYQCSVSGCVQVRKRLDHFQKHVKQAHKEYDVEQISRDSAVLLVESENRNGTERASSSRHSALAEDHGDEGVIDQSDDVTLADSAIGLPILPGPCGAQSFRSIDPDRSRRARAFPTQSETLASRRLVALLRKVQARHLHESQALRLPDTAAIAVATDYDDCDVPVDAGHPTTARVYGELTALFPVQGNGFGQGGDPGNNDRPFDCRDEERDNDPTPGGGQPSGSSNGQMGQLPCVYCRFHGPEEDPYRHCSNRKCHMSQLWVHHCRHRLFVCWTCFARFDSRDEVEDHRRGGCETLCVTPGCNNYNGFSSPESPCNNHGNYILPALKWQMLYRKAHDLSLDDWVPDPLVEDQDVPPGLPWSHPMAAYSQQDPSLFDSLTGNVLSDTQQSETLFGAGMWDIQFDQAVESGPATEHTSASPSADISGLTSVLRTLWGLLSSRYPPAWTPLTANMFQAGVRPFNQQPMVGGVQGQERYTVMLEVLAHQYASLIINPAERTIEGWIATAEWTRGLLGNQVQIPDECPWDLSGGPTPSSSRSSQYQQPQLPTLRPAGVDMNPTHDMTLPDGMYLNRESIPQFALQATYGTFLAAPQTLYHDRGEPSQDRRASLASLTSPSDALYYSARSSPFVTRSLDGLTGIGFQQNTTPNPDPSEQWRHMDENGNDEQFEIMEDID